jgi:hypothetical protein
MGAASGGGGQQLSVQDGCTWRRGAWGGDGEFGGGHGNATRWLDGSRNGSIVGATGGGGRKEAPWRGWVPYIAARGGGRRAARRQTGGRETAAGKSWAQQGSGSRCLRMVSVVWALSGP